jgi:hypothetical protein
MLNDVFVIQGAKIHYHYHIKYYAVIETFCQLLLSNLTKRVVQIEQLFIKKLLKFFFECNSFKK